MSKWRAWAEGCSFGFDLGDGLPPLLDLRFADNILIFARFSHEIMSLLDKQVQVLGDGGLKLNAQPPPFLTTSTGAVIGHKWFACMLSAAGSLPSKAIGFV